MPRLPRLPDLLTTANLVCGVGSILLASQGQLTIACGLIFLAAVFDVFDGLAARALGGGTALGAQLDSLADMVSFGVAPGVFVYQLASTGIIAALLGKVGLVDDPALLITWNTIISIGLAAVIVGASAWRLAKFNMDTRQSNGFLGLPTPANALFWTSFLYGANAVVNEKVPDGPALAMLDGLFNPYVFIVLVFGLAWLMLSELPLPSLKLKSLKWRGNEVIYLLLLAGACLLLLYGILAVPLILVLYLLSPVWGKLFRASSH